MNTPTAFRSAARDSLQDFDAVRKHTVTLSRSLSEEDCCAQSMPDASPVKWHMAHTTWFFETFILERFEPDFTPHHAAFRMLFNSYYNGVGEKHARAQRGLLTRPGFDEVLAYRHAVDARIARLIEKLWRQDCLVEVAQLIRLGLQHEQQHQELMLTDVKHLLSINPMRPAYAEPAVAASAAQQTQAQTASCTTSKLGWRSFDAGIISLGHIGQDFCFDNETPRHRQFVEPFMLASRLVTNGEYLAFINDGAYRNPAWWLSEGWDWVCANQLTQPLYWQLAGKLAEPQPEPCAETHNDTANRDDASQWQEFTLHGLQPLDQHRPVTHLSYFEADAYARWVGARLPTEAEWERAALGATDVAARGLQPAAASEPATDTLTAQLFGACWQWTASSYAPYPGYATAPGAIGEYNGKFMSNQYVLRGSSCVTPVGHSRPTYRNFFPATARWQFSGLRLARSCG